MTPNPVPLAWGCEVAEAGTGGISIPALVEIILNLLQRDRHVGERGDLIGQDVMEDVSDLPAVAPVLLGADPLPPY